MKHQSLRPHLLLLAVTLFAASALSQTPAPMRFSYTVAMPQPHTHLYEVTFTISNVTGPQLDVSLPTWTPGSYLQREYARHVQDFAARADNGQPLAWEKSDKATWRITTGATSSSARTVQIFYRVYANELATQTSHLDATHGYFNGATLFMYVTNVAGAKEQPYKVKFQLAGATAQWRVSSPLALAPDADGYFTAPNYDVLVDSPTEIGTHQLLEFSVRGKPHRIALWPGIPAGSGISDNRLTTDLAKIVEESAKIFNGLPYEHYLFILHVQPGLGGGTEHLNSNVSMTRPDAFKTRRGYDGLLGLEAHEYFHCFNVKRIRPRALGPFDYQHENYTNNLWVSEGMTSYYGDQVLRRAGLISATEYLQAWGKTIADYRQTPGRFEQSATTASFNAWIKHYRPDENSPNTAMSYYTKGEILGMMFDLEIRSRTANAKSLDDVMRLLLDKYGLPKPGFTDAELKAAFEQVAGTDLTDFFTRYVYNPDRPGAEIEFERYWRMLGLQATGVYGTGENAQPKLLSPPSPPGTLGLRTRNNGDRVIVSNVLAGFPAYDAGLNNNDELVALGGQKLDAANLAERLAELRPGQYVTLTVFRRERLQTFTLTTALKPFDTYTFALAKDATPEQKTLAKAWLGEELK
ncbi:MAG: M61 family metallopeptidase [Acidobacteria bacterium]|nr:M61 family metallopeptidase [Acidobacteriota bacterium]MBI3426637.1 M61 family metallopeptidase [Acidobacteriota bacterium]